MSNPHPEPSRETALPSLCGTILRQLHSLAPVLLTAYAPTAAILVALVVVHITTGIPIRYFTIDPAAEFNAPMYVGAVSNLGVLLWCSVAAVCLFTGFVLSTKNRDREFSLFVLCSGLFTGLLLCDDLFLLHEELLPDHFFIPQKLVFAAYMALALAYLLRFRAMILSTDYLLLLFAMVFFALSVFVDLFIHPEEFFIFGGLPGRHLIEDGLKLFGIVSWAAYFLCVCERHLRLRLPEL